jgi:two-component response regulator (ARR-B family)
MIKGITLGACAYWVKPACAKEIRNMWQHVVRKKLSLRSRDNRSGYVDADDKAQSETAGGERVFEKRSRKYSMNEINDGDGSHENKENVSELSTRKKPRMAWTNELNDRFKEVVHQLGIDSKNSLFSWLFNQSKACSFSFVSSNKHTDHIWECRGRSDEDIGYDGCGLHH